MADVPRTKFVTYVVGALLLGGAIGAVAAGVLDSDSSSTSASSTRRTTTTTTIVTTTTAPTPSGGPPCTANAVLQAIQLHGISATSVAGVQCGNGWAGASYESSQAAGAALLRAQGNQWVFVDRAQNCNDPSIPTTVHTYCTVS